MEVCLFHQNEWRELCGKERKISLEQCLAMSCGNHHHVSVL